MANYSLADSNPKVDDVPGLFQRMQGDGTQINLAKNNINLPDYNTLTNHLQGIVGYNKNGVDYYYMSHSAHQVGFVIIVNGTANKMIRSFWCASLDDGYTHAGGMQIIGDYLVVSLQSASQSLIKFFELADPENPVENLNLRVVRSNQPQAGCVAIVKYDPTSAYYLMVQYSHNNVDIYAANVSLNNPSCSFQLFNVWDATAVDKTNWQPDKNWGDYQGMGLISDRNDNFYLIGFNTTPGGLVGGNDWADLFSFDPTQQSDKMITKLANLHLTTEGGHGPSGYMVHFRWGSGLRIVNPETMHFFASERNIHDPTCINSFTAQRIR